MADNDQSAEDLGTSPAPTQTPVVGQADLDAFKQSLLAEINRANDERFGGFQKLLAKRDKRFDDLAATLDELKSRSLTDEDREELETRAAAERVRVLEAENELLRLSREYPAEVVSDFETLLKADNARDQLDLLRTLRSGNQSATTAAAPATPAVPAEGEGFPNVQPASSEVDPNNPPAEAMDGLAFEQAFERDPSLVDKILRAGKLR